jgi:hypothetical protein
MGSGTIKFKKTEVARIIEGIKMSGARGTIEFQLQEGIVKFVMAGESESGPAAAPSQAANEWDTVK